MKEEYYKAIDPTFNSDPNGKRQKVIDDIMNKVVLEHYNNWLKDEK